MANLLEPRWKSYVVETLEPVLTLSQCDEVIRLGQSAEDEVAKIGLDPEPTNKNISLHTFDKERRLCTISWIPFDQGREMYKKIEGWVVNTNNNHFGFDGIQVTEPAQYTEYSIGGFYGWHTDSELVMKNMPPVRKISMTLLLNDPKDFEGGELELIDSKKQPNLKRGHAVFFASFIRHQIKPVTKGNRKSLVMWFGGPPFK